MKKQTQSILKILFLTLASLSFTLMASEHSAEKPKSNDLNDIFELSGNIESVAYQTCYIKEAENKSCMQKIVIFFDAQGNQTGKQKFSHDGKLLEKTLIDDQGEYRQIYRVVDADGKLLRKVVVIRSATHGKIIEMKNFSKDNQLESSSKMSYNPDGTQKMFVDLDKEGNQLSKTLFKYNDKQQMTQQTSVGAAGQFTQSYVYDENGNQIGTDIALHQLEFNERNHWIQRKIYSSVYQQNKHTNQLSRIDYRTISYRD